MFKKYVFLIKKINLIYRKSFCKVIKKKNGGRDNNTHVTNCIYYFY